MTVGERPSHAATQLLTAVSIGILQLGIAISLAALVFSESLAPGAGRAAVGFVLGTGIVSAVVGLTTRMPVAVAGSQDTAAIVMAAVAASLAASTTTEGALPTVVVMVALCALLTGLAFWFLGAKSKTSFVRYLPWPVITGFTAGTGWLLLRGGVEVMHGAGIEFTELPDRVKDVEIWLPHTEITELVALRTDAPVEVAPRGDRRVWVHHGSSISHGSNAASPSTTWPGLTASSGGVELVNLGFGGSALLDPFTARTVRDVPADLISIKIGINLVNSDLMRLRAFGPAVHGFLDTIREGHPTTPLLVVSPVYCPIHEDTPGPGAVDFDDGRLSFRATGDPAERAAGKLTLSVIREELAGIVEQRAADDPALSYLDGRDLYGEADFAELPLPDRLHPDPAAHRRIGDRFTELVFGTGGPFAPQRA